MFMATAYQGNKPYIFLSYAHVDRKLADYVVDYLHEHNFKVWFDEGIHSGDQWKDVILEKIANPNCWMMVFLVTQNSLASIECRREIKFAEKKKKKFINVVIGSPQFPDWFICDFDEYQFVDEAEFASRNAMMDKLVKELIHHQMNTDKPKDTPKETPKETPKAKAPEISKVPKASAPTQKSSEPSVAPKGPLKLNTADGLKFTVTDGTATVTGYAGTETKVIIPSAITYNGKTYKVTAIGKWAFFWCTNLTSITIPNSVISIGDGAFGGCENIDVDKNNTHYKSIDGNLYSKDGTTLIQYAIGKTKTSFTIPDHVNTIGEWAFSRCENLTSITIPNSVTTIGESAFFGCDNLTIYCEAKSKPEGWHAKWNPRNRPVFWGYIGE